VDGGTVLRAASGCQAFLRHGPWVIDGAAPAGPTPAPWDGVNPRTG
jgi:hypothetical protein